jgi:hypothetical protein
MATHSSKDPGVHAMASRLAEYWSTSKTGAIRRALSQAIAGTDIDAEVRSAQIQAVLAQIRPHVIPGVDRASIDGDLYDEHGLPR